MFYNLNAYISIYFKSLQKRECVYFKFIGRTTNLQNLPTTHLKRTYLTIKSRFTFCMSMYTVYCVFLLRGIRDIRVNNTSACESGMGTSSTTTEKA